VNYPDWFSGELGVAGQRHANRELTRPQAVKALADEIVRHGDREFLAAVAAAFAAKALDSWHRGRRQAAAVPGFRDEAQSELFPGLPGRLYVTPGQSKAVILFTGHDWDTARNVLENRTSGAITAAQADWAAFRAAYDRIRPLLSGDLTTADVAGQLDGAFLRTATGPA
jgi:hypothetical protein